MSISKRSRKRATASFTSTEPKSVRSSAKQITVPYKTDHGMAEKKFTVYCTHHGPIIREQNGKWVSIRLMQEPDQGAQQSYMRTKARDYKSFRQTMELKANSSNNTIFADADGDIAYFHGNFIPRRDTSFDWTKPVDGSNPATDWKGLLSVDELPHLLNPKERLALQHQQLALVRRWREQPAQAGLPRLRRDRRRIRARPARHPRPAGQEGFHARLAHRRGLRQLSALVREAHPRADQGLGRAPPADPLKAKLADQIALLRNWDYRWGVDLRSHLARRVLGRGHPPPRRRRRQKGRHLRRRVHRHQGLRRSNSCNRSPRPPTDSPPISAPGRRPGATSIDSSASTATSSSPSTTPAQAFPSASPRRSGARSPRSARAPTPEQRSGTAPAATASSPWSSSATRCAPRPSPPAARAAIPTSPHFNDEAKRYSTGDLREVYFYRSDLKGHTEREYHPGS